MSVVNLRTLVLTPGYVPVSVFPLHTISSQEAIVRYLKHTADVVYWYDKPILTQSRTDLYWPSVIVEKRFRHIHYNVKLKKTTLFYRDHLRCFWCDDDLSLTEMSYDHIVPRSKGGKHVWENVVSSCRKCNYLKADSMPTGKWLPKKKVYAPTFFQLLEIRKKFPIIVNDESWVQFLPNWAGEVIINTKKIR